MVHLSILQHPPGRHAQNGSGEVTQVMVNTTEQNMDPI